MPKKIQFSVIYATGNEFLYQIVINVRCFENIRQVKIQNIKLQS